MRLVWMKLNWNNYIYIVTKFKFQRVTYILYDRLVKETKNIWNILKYILIGKVFNWLQIRQNLETEFVSEIWSAKCDSAIWTNTFKVYQEMSILRSAKSETKKLRNETFPSSFFVYKLTELRYLKDFLCFSLTVWGQGKNMSRKL